MITTSTHEVECAPPFTFVGLQRMLTEAHEHMDRQAAAGCDVGEPEVLVNSARVKVRWTTRRETSP